MQKAEKMDHLNRIERIYEKAPVISINKNSRYVFFSDCHRGYGGWNDNFAGNQYLCFHAMQYYYQKGFHYVEVGDGDELWENRSPVRIIENYSHIFWMMRRFYRQNRLFLLWGNHDNKKRKTKYVEKYYKEFYNSSENKWEELFPEIRIEEALRLQAEDRKELFVIHGHQGEILNDYLAPMAEMLVRYLWTPLEKLGVRDPTRTAYNYKCCVREENRFSEFAKKKSILVLCGHTHRPMLPEPGEGSYLNDGSQVHPRCITAIELEGGRLSLVKWSVLSRRDASLYVGREVLKGPYLWKKYFEQQIQVSKSR